MRYYSFNTYLREKFGCRVHRLSLNGGFACPNRDGTLSGEGCIYCNEKGFSRFADDTLSLKEQIERGIEFAVSRYKAEKFIAYFQNAAGTYAPVDRLKETYDVIKEYPDIAGLFISTRPDCVDAPKLDLMAGYTGDYEVWVEYGLQTVHDKTLSLINRNHTFKQALEAINAAADKGIKVGVHVILGLPGESEADMMETARVIASLPVSGVKFHVLHVLKDTSLNEMFRAEEIKLLDMQKYIDIITRFMEFLRKDQVILRLVSDAKEELLVAPAWMREKQTVIRAIGARFEETDAFQGKLHRAA